MERLRSSSPHRRQRGIALLTALVLMLAVLMTGIASSRGALQSARAAAHERDRVLAVQMADAALLDAEHDIEGGAEPGSARANAILAGSTDAFVAGCGGGTPYKGLCAHVVDPAETSALLADDDGPAVAFGSYTSASMPGGEGGLALEAPRYLIELMPAAPAASPPPPGPAPPPAQLYRITARGAGSMPGTHAAVQAYYRKPTDGSPGRRVGWRELGNWSELYAASSAATTIPTPGHLNAKERR